MKFYKPGAVLCGFVAFVLALQGLVSSAKADLDLPTLIRVDISNPTAVSFSATGAAPIVSDTTDSEFGFTLQNLFTSDFVVGPPGNGMLLDVAGLAPPSPGIPAYILNDYASLTYRDLNFYEVLAGNGPQNFSTGSAAFTGTSVHDLSGASFPPLGTTGIIFAGDTMDGSGATLGQWVVVPEPSGFLYGGLISSIVGCGVWAKRRFV